MYCKTGFITAQESEQYGILIDCEQLEQVLGSTKPSTS